MPINDEKRKINVTEWSVFKLSAVLLYYTYIYIYNVSCTISEENCCLSMLLYHITVVNRILLYEFIISLIVPSILRRIFHVTFFII